MPGPRWTDAEIRTVLHSYGVPLDQLARQVPGRSLTMLAEYRRLIHRFHAPPTLVGDQRLMHRLERAQDSAVLSRNWRRALHRALQAPGVRCPECGASFWE